MVKFYYAPWSRAFGVLWLLEELGVEYDRFHVDIRAAIGVPEAYRAIQPNKKVPAIDHDGLVVTERAAITIYLADAFPDAGLAPPIGSKERARFLTAAIYVDSVLDPCVAAKAHGLDYKSAEYSFGVFKDMVAYVERRLHRHSFASGDHFTAADTQLGAAIDFSMNRIKVLPERPVFQAYLERVKERPAYKRATAIDNEEARRVPVLLKQMAQTAVP